MNPLPNWKVERIKKLCKEGLNQTEIAKRLGISQWSVHKHDPRKLDRAFKRLERLL